MALSHILYVGNDNVIEFAPGKFLTDATDDTTVAAATVTVRLLDTSEVEILAAVTMSAVAGESGNYRGTIPDTFDLSSYTDVIAEVTADNGAGAKAAWKLEVEVKVRR